ncbi:DMT family transporter [Paenibacillus pini]|uniref:Permease n=1 Tax=Paenibacillus pini JCM 16418 TaxID=1236976 RepID=W7YJB0_9BACL|nr:DMT family transporter [Paenibacillus pini]GAF07703.1 permease [Paenibacillus pini JCM 16418]
MKQYKADLIILMITLFWGSSYLFMKMGLDSVEPFNLIALRFGIAFIISAIVFHKRLRTLDRQTVKHSALLGLFLFGVFASIMIGLKSTSTSNAGFLMSLTVIFVPVISAIFLKNKPDKRLVCGVVLALTGIGFLTLKSSSALHVGDLWCILAALLFAIHIIWTGRSTKVADSLNLGIIQLGFAGVFGLIFSIIFETPHLPVTLPGWTSVLVLSIVCSAIGFILQAIAQQYTTPTHTGLIFALEPVVAALIGIIYMHETLSLQGYIGAGLVLLGVTISELKWSWLPAFTRKKAAHPFTPDLNLPSEL